MILAYLLRYYRREGAEAGLEVVTVSLDEMARGGGIYDQLGEGFHRYSVDERWLVPHFEKMLYDNVLLAAVYLEAYQVTGRAFSHQVVEETLEYVQREMRDPAGGFYSSEDADSEGEEGKLYVWTPQEVEQGLGGNEAKIFSEYFDVTAGGHFEGRNILHHRVDQEAYAARLGCSTEALEKRLNGAPSATFSGARQTHPAGAG